MAAPPSHPDPLVAQLPALRRLAVALVGADRSEDLVQEAALSALAADAPRSPAALITILRRRAIDAMRRGAHRRSVGDAPEPSDDGATDPAGTAERVESMRALVSALGALPAAQREALVLCTFDGLTPSEAAARLGVNASTVRSRVARGLEALRAELSRGRGEGGWAAIVLPLAGLRPEAGAAAAPAGATGAALTLATLTTMWKLIGTAACALLAALVLVQMTAPDEDRRDPGSATPGRTEEIAAVTPVPDAPESSGGRAETDAESVEAEPGSATTDAATQDEPAAAAAIAGVVVLLDGTPVGEGVTVTAAPSAGGDPVTARTDRGGRFVFEGLAEGTFEVRATLFGAAAPSAPVLANAGDDDVGLRVDALVLDIIGPDLEGRDATFSVAAFGGPEGAAPYRTQIGRPDAPITVASGPGYLIGENTMEAERHAVVDPGLPSGAYDVLLEEGSSALGRLEVTLSGEPLRSSDRVSVRLRPTESSGLPGHQSASVWGRRGEAGGVTLRRNGGQGILPGRYRVEVHVMERPSELAPLVAIADRAEVEILAGAAASIEVEMKRGAGVAVIVTGPEEEGEAGPRNYRRGRYSVEVLDAETGSWRALTLRQSADGTSWITRTTFLPDVRMLSRALPPGPTRLRLLDKREAAAETEVTLVAGDYVEVTFNLAR